MPERDDTKQFNAAMENARFQGDVASTLKTMESNITSIKESAQRTSEAVTSMGRELLKHETECNGRWKREEEKREEIKADVMLIKANVEGHKTTLIKWGVGAAIMQAIILLVLVPIIVSVASASLSAKLEAVIKDKKDTQK